MSTLTSRLTKAFRTPGAGRDTRRDHWQRFVTVNGAVTCCGHCPAPCQWANWHYGVCAHCLDEMKASRPLADCITDIDGRCITCAQLHGVRITHGERT